MPGGTRASRHSRALGAEANRHMRSQRPRCVPADSERATWCAQSVSCAGPARRRCAPAGPRAPNTAPAAPPAGAARAGRPAARIALGRDTPRGTVPGIPHRRAHGRRRRSPSQYLNTRLTGRSRGALAHQLFVVLDARLPPRLGQVSDQPDGSRRDPLAPDREIIGMVDGADGVVDIVVERVQRDRDASRSGCSQPTPWPPCPRSTTKSRWSAASRCCRGPDEQRELAASALVEWLAVLLGLRDPLPRHGAVEQAPHAAGRAALAAASFEGIAFRANGMSAARRGCCSSRWRFNGCSASCRCSLLVRQFWSSTAVAAHHCRHRVAARFC